MHARNLLFWAAQLSRVNAGVDLCTTTYQAPHLARTYAHMWCRSEIAGMGMELVWRPLDVNEPNGVGAS